MNLTRPASPKGAGGGKKMQKFLLEWVLPFLLVIVITLLVRTFLFEPVRVDGNSMLDTLHDREFMFTTRLDYWLGDPRRFDVVTCYYPNRGDTVFVKRVVGLPGETVELREGQLYINGETVAQDFDLTESRRNFGPYEVAEDHYFVMGDNRGNSRDSRDPAVGALPRQMIRGHVRAVVFPLNAIRGIGSGGANPP